MVRQVLRFLSLPANVIIIIVNCHPVRFVIYFFMSHSEAQVVILEKAAGCLTDGPAFPGNPTVPAGPAEP